MNNKKLGSDFETTFCETLYRRGFWVHNFAQNQDGQPADVIAVKKGKAYLIDCKVCSKEGFAFSRVEMNQDLSMILWRNCDNGEGWFAFLLEDRIHMISHTTIKRLAKGMSRLSNDEISSYILLEDWITVQE